MTLHHPKIVEDLIAIPKVNKLLFPGLEEPFFALLLFPCLGYLGGTLSKY